ncbi:MAG: hypothetical protein V1688_02900 [bacterium]
MFKTILKSNLSFYFVLYLIIFLFFPFILLKPQFLVRDVAWFIDYFIFIFPLTFFVFLLIVRNFSKLFNNYRKDLLWFWMTFIIIYFLTIFYSYNIVLGAFEGFRLF